MPRKGWAFRAEEAMALLGRRDVALIDLREKRRSASGTAPFPVRCTRPMASFRTISATAGSFTSLAVGQDARFLLRLRRALGDGGAGGSGYGPRNPHCHIEGGMSAWKKAHGPLTH